MDPYDTFRARIAPWLPDLDQQSDLDAFRSICQFSYSHCSLATTLTDHIKMGGAASDLDSNMDKFEREEGGVWCAHAALVCAQMVNASRRVEKAWYYADGIPEMSHATVLASIDGVLYHYDPYFNGEYVDHQGQSLPFLETLSAIKSMKPPRWRQNFAEKNIHATSIENLREWTEGEVSPVLYRLKSGESGSRRGIGRGVVTAKAFRNSYYDKVLVDQALIKLGYPPEPVDQLWDYLRLHPMALENSDNTDLDQSKVKVLAVIQSTVG